VDESGGPDRPPVWDGAEPPPPPPADPEADRRRRHVLAGVVLVTAVLGVLITDLTDRRDAAVLYVGLPALLAFGIAWGPRPRSLHGAVAAGTTFALLLAAMLLQEGAICVLLSAPLVFAVAHTVAAVTRRMGGRGPALLALPLLVASLEGVAPDWRIQPVQTVTVEQTVAADRDTVADRLAAGPDLADAHRPLLVRPGFPLPSHAEGDGLAAGDRWTFDYRGKPIVTEVVARHERPDGGTVTFALVHDGSKTARWLTWEEATLRWTERDDGRGTDVEVAVTFERGLDPSWWFGPVEDAFVRAGTSYLLDGLVGDLVQP
jgi:hypothetical protein